MRLQSDNQSWFIGVVENRIDPFQQGRVQVRVAGVHCFSRIQGDIQGIPVEDLPWMTVGLPVTTASTSGIGGPITGLVNGASVFGFWLDKYKTNGIITNVYSGNQVNIPNSEEGFSDPNGQYPHNAGPDIAGLNAGGAYGDNSGTNASQDANTSTGILTGGKDAPGEDNNPSLSIEKMIMAEEGQNNNVHWVDEYPHVGIGHLIVYQRTRDMKFINTILSRQVGRQVNGSITQSEATTLFTQDLNKVRSEIRKNAFTAPVYAKINRSRQMALENMAFQMGTGGVANFKTMLSQMAAGKWAEAASSAKQSLWARQTPGRANRVALIIKNGNIASYGVMPPSGGRVGKMILQNSFSPLNSFLNGFNPFDDSDNEIEPDYDNIPIQDSSGEDLSVPYVPEDTGVLFSEPKSTYRGVYPYVKATKTEGGHTVEYDDTPGQERFRSMHPSGSYHEDAADGRRTDKSFGDRYLLTVGTRCDLVEGEYKTNIGGTETTVNFADVIRNVDGNKSHVISGNHSNDIGGNNDIIVKGNETKKITGSGTIEVGAGIKIIVNGNADITVNGNSSNKVSGNYSLDVSGTYNITSGAVTWTTPRFDLI